MDLDIESIGWTYLAWGGGLMLGGVLGWVLALPATLWRMGTQELQQQRQRLEQQVARAMECRRGVGQGVEVGRIDWGDPSADVGLPAREAESLVPPARKSPGKP